MDTDGRFYDDVSSVRASTQPDPGVKAATKWPINLVLTKRCIALPDEGVTAGINEIVCKCFVAHVRLALKNPEMKPGGLGGPAAVPPAFLTATSHPQ